MKKKLIPTPKPPKGGLLFELSVLLFPKVYPLKSPSGGLGVRVCVALILLTNLSLSGQTLDDYLKMSAENNPELKANYAEYEASIQRIAQVKGLEDPIFSVSAFGQMVETRTGQQMAQFSIEQMFPWFGTLKAKGDVAALEAEAKLKNFMEARNILFNDVKQAYYSVQEVEEMQKLRERNLEILNTYKSLATSRFQQGKVPMVDVVRVNISIEQTKADMSSLKIERKSSLSVLNRLLNRNLSEEVVFNEPLHLPEVIPFNEDSLSAHPRIATIDRMISASAMQQTVAKKAGMPMLGLGFNYIVIDERMDEHVEGNGKDAYMPMFTVSLPIYRKKYRAMAKEAELMKNSYQSMRDNEINSLHSEFTMAMNDLEEATLRYEMYHHHVEFSKQAIQLLLSALETSNAAIEEVLKMQEELLMHEEGKVKAVISAWMALAKIEYLKSNDK